MRSFVAALLLSFSLFSCDEPKGDYKPFVVSVLESLSTVSKTLPQDSNACLVGASLSAIADASLVVVKSDQLVLPAVDVDVSKCSKFKAPDTSVVERSVVSYVNLGTVMATTVIDQVVQGADKVSCKDKNLSSAILAYIRNVEAAVVAELADVDGKVKIPSVTVAPCPNP